MAYHPEWLSEGGEVLVAEIADNDRRGQADGSRGADFDVVIVGSGYGGSVAAARLAGATDGEGKPLSVCVLERGREHVPGTFPSRFAELPGYVRFSREDEAQAKGPPDGLYDFRLGGDVSVLLGNGLGGGSLINASVAERAPSDVFADSAWPQALRNDGDGLASWYGRAEAMLGVQPASEATAKHAAFRRFAEAARLPARPAHIAVNRKNAAPNAQGVLQQPCIECGDCVTGCNAWAKNTLAMNYLPEAKSRGARLFTNVTVKYVSRVPADGGGWDVHFGLTVAPHPPLQPAGRSVRARHVILAAGAYGSTEILLRSRAQGLAVSDRLGTRASTNGDMISVLYGQREEVNTAPEETTPCAKRNVGPTITGIMAAGAPDGRRVVVEELSIPAPLRRIFEEVVTTGALPVRLVIADRDRHAPEDPDPEAVDPGRIRRSQVFAAMGDDGAAGRFEMADGWQGTTRDGAVRLVWPGAGKHAVYEAQDSVLQRAADLSGGLYLRSPLWRPFPEALSKLLSGAKPEGKLFSVHPLGGCPMGESARDGVVDHVGRVFDAREPARVHDGLLVLDGAIVPRALGINPLLTIAALAERAVALYAADRGWSISYAPAPCALPPLPEAIEPEAPPAPTDTAVRFAEKMTGALRYAPDGARVDTDLCVEFSEIDRIPEFLRRGPHRVAIAQASLKLASGSEARLSGEVQWLARGATRRWGRVVRALFTWLRTRGVADFFQRLRKKGWRDALRMFTEGGAVLELASNLGEVRHLRYTMRLEDDLAIDDTAVLARGTRIEGLKVFRYAVGGNPWRQLTELAVTIVPPGARRVDAGILTVDLNHMFRRFATQLQIVRQRDLPTAIMDVASIALFIARLALKIHFWSFRAPEYEEHDPARQGRRLPGPLSGLNCTRDEVTVSAASLRLPLTRYFENEAQGKPPVLLIHGFGSSGIQFSHPRLERNLVRHLAGEGYDVWVCELRTSIALESSAAQWTLDEVAREDIPAIMRRVIELTHRDQLDVVAHCIGSAMFCTAVLGGHVRGLVRQAVLLQVGPLITLSKGNEFRGHAAGAMRRYLGVDHVDSSVDSRADWQDVLIDRLLWTYPYPAEEQEHHALRPPYRAHTHIANCNRSAAVFGRLFQHANLAPAMLDALGDLLGRTNLKTFEQTVQYAFVKRLTDYEACNAYVVDDNVRRYFNFPVRFLHGELNDVFHPDTTLRSLQLLLDVFGESHLADRVVLEGYGHLDPLVGQNAHRDVYPHISGFLGAAATRRAPAAAVSTVRYAKQPLVGPVLGWTRRDESGRWVARIWCRTDDEHAYARFLMAVVMKDGSAVPGHSSFTPLERRRGPLPAGPAPDGAPAPGMPERSTAVDLIGAIDVVLPDEEADYEIVVAGAYESAEAHLPAEVPAFDRTGVFAELAPTPDEKAMIAAQAPQAGTLDDRLGQALGMLRAMPGWSAPARDGDTAPRACDDDYDGRADSVKISKALLQRLDPGARRLTFALASCRYTASMLDRERADAGFARLLDVVRNDAANGNGPALLLLVGDQIYADSTAGLFDAKTRRARYYDAYREAWTAPHAREMLRRVPVYMMLDDHEVGDNWHPDDPDDGMHKAWGLRAFEDYQLRLAPKPLDPQKLMRDEPQPPYFYAFEAAGFPFFMCDTRTDRQGSDSILSQLQFDALKRWLADHNGDNRPKFVVSPSVVVPFKRASRGRTERERTAYASRSDGWDRFRRSLHDLFAFVAGERIRNVVFLSGDAHLSMASRISFDGGGAGGLQALSIVSSPMYAPYPFANQKFAELQPDNHDDPLALPEGMSMRYACEPASVVGGDSFTLVSATPHGPGWTITTSTRTESGPPREVAYELP